MNRSCVRTTVGELSPSDIKGVILPHEHLAMSYGSSESSPRLDREDAVVAELSALRSRGVLGLLVDLTCSGLGRNARTAQRVSAASGVPVVVASGYYWERYHPPYVADSSVEQITERLLDEIANGLDGSGVLPGVIGEVGSHGENPSPPEARCLKAAAQAALASGLSVFTHADLGLGGLRQLHLLMAEGLAPDRICIGHQDLLDDSAVHMEIASMGAYVAFDTVGKESYQTDAVRVRLVAALVDAGYAHRVLLSNDVSRNVYLDRPSGGYGYLIDAFLPKLRAFGLEEQTIRLITEDNALRLLIGEDFTSQLPDRSQPPNVRKVDTKSALIELRVLVSAPAGLHARPAAIFAEAAQKSGVAVQIGKDPSAMVNAASILSILTLDIRVGDEVVLTAEGSNAEKTLDELVLLLSNESA